MGLLAQIGEHLRIRPQCAVPRALREEFARALAAYEAGADLGAAFKACDVRRQDAALRRCGELLAPAGSTWQRAGLIAGLATRARESSWRPISEAERAFDAARKAGPVPSTQRRIADRL